MGHTLYDIAQKVTQPAGVVAVRPSAGGLGSGVPVYGAAPTYPLPTMIPTNQMRPPPWGRTRTWPT